MFVLMYPWSLQQRFPNQSPLRCRAGEATACCRRPNRRASSRCLARGTRRADFVVAVGSSASLTGNGLSGGPVEVQTSFVLAGFARLPVHSWNRCISLKKNSLFSVCIQKTWGQKLNSLKACARNIGMSRTGFCSIHKGVRQGCRVQPITQTRHLTGYANE